MSLRPRLQKRVRNKKESIDIWTNFVTDDYNCYNTNRKIMALNEQLSEEVRSNDKYTYHREVTREQLLTFFGTLYASGLLGKKFLKLRRLCVGYPIFSASISFNRLVFTTTMIFFDDASTRQERW